MSHEYANPRCEKLGLQVDVPQVLHNKACLCNECLVKMPPLPEGPALNVRRGVEQCTYVVPPNDGIVTRGLTTDSKQRKDTPVYSGVLAYFPLALAEVARLSKAGNEKHNPGQPLHWSKDKSNDHADCIARHLLELGTVDPDDGFLHDVKLAWRALANLQIRLEGGK